MCVCVCHVCDYLYHHPIITALDMSLQFTPVILSHSLRLSWLVVFNVPSTAKSFRDGTPIYCPLRRT